MTYVKHYRELEVYKVQRLLSKAVFVESKRFPKEEQYSLTDQIRRSSRSIGAQIAEAWAKCLYPKHFISKLTDADGEQLETQHWLTESYDCGYITAEKQTELTQLCESIGRMLGSMIRKADTFTGNDFLLREDTPEYLAEEHEAHS
ncbi:MAG: four helix bundle protein [Prosthecobacter sp.]|nr:four helix bundle protein [Prosthecobacter sp.]